MIIGDPYKFAIMFDEVREWSTCDRLSGHFAFCMNGKMLPEGIINAILDNALAKVYDKLKNAPEDVSHSRNSIPTGSSLYPSGKSRYSCIHNYLCIWSICSLPWFWRGSLVSRTSICPSIPSSNDLPK